MGRTCSAHVLPMFCAFSFHDNFMNNLLSYYGLVDARIRASEKDLPVISIVIDSIHLDSWLSADLRQYCYYLNMFVPKFYNISAIQNTM